MFLTVQLESISDSDSLIRIDFCHAHAKREANLKMDTLKVALLVYVTR